ncbi:hypothetical protein [Piscirickettsia litoralis]|uniref:Uncharacterized protein n=1 Tax=Piscirickettsia litoralis TaxID=1891921 RepID=A0ABX3A6L7_9GAMM|nr:hypothetical protein [Piscirickettsia litoralis]ODN43283.1 hypothetical protein BGC07_10580 [Piscirickettsia litoralis]
MDNMNPAVQRQRRNLLFVSCICILVGIAFLIDPNIKVTKASIFGIITIESQGIKLLFTLLSILIFFLGFFWWRFTQHINEDKGEINRQRALDRYNAFTDASNVKNRVVFKDLAFLYLLHSPNGPDSRWGKIASEKLKAELQCLIGRTNGLNKLDKINDDREHVGYIDGLFSHNEGNKFIFIIAVSYIIQNGNYSGSMCYQIINKKEEADKLNLELNKLARKNYPWWSNYRLPMYVALFAFFSIMLTSCIKLPFFLHAHLYWYIFSQMFVFTVVATLGLYFWLVRAS